MKKLILFFVLAAQLLACNVKKNIADPAAYSIYLNGNHINASIKSINSEAGFWENMLRKDTGNYVYKLELARYRLKLFKLTGNIEALLEGDSLLHRSSEKLNHSEPELLFALSQNSITRHRFLQAAAFTDKAEKAQGDLYAIRLLEFDAAMELGQLARAQKSLESLRDKTSFDYLIRKAKWEDHNGNLDNAIQLMEQALEKTVGKNKNSNHWVLSNLGDMYGHAGRIKDAYNAFHSVLREDSSNIYCLRGIAWIAYSYDNNYEEAKRILRFILSQVQMPELKLILAEIAEAEGDMKQKQKWTREFLSDVQTAGYGDMYNKYLIGVYAEELKDFSKAMVLAKREASNRFTPETCDWLAWVNYQMGDYDEAYKLARAYVYRFTHEPDALMHTGFIFAAKGMNSEAKELLEECMGSSFELGPLATKKIKEKLNLLK